MICSQLAQIGKILEGNPELANITNLKIWSDWALLHLITLFVTYEQVGPDLYDLDLIKQIVTKYFDDFNQLISLLKKNVSRLYFTVYFREENYFTYPLEGQKRWWLEAKIRLEENNFHKENSHWESSEYKVHYNCVTTYQLYISGAGSCAID